jgi:lantibiotic modifying enzyme
MCGFTPPDANGSNNSDLIEESPLQVLAMAMHHVRKMPSSSDLEMWIRSSASNVVSQLVHETGNLPSSFGSSRDELVQWCHGAPGLSMMLATMHAVFGSECPQEFQQFMKKSLEVVWQRGLLKKGIGLCHGIPGNGYAFLSALRATSQHSFYAQALSFGIFSVQV